MVTKQRLQEILEPAHDGDRTSRVFDIFIMSLISLNVVAVILETVEEIRQSLGAFLLVFEIGSVAIFTIEYLLRIWSCTVHRSFAAPVTGRLRYAMRPMLLIDLLAILPAYLTVLPIDLRFLRALRLLRIFRLLRLHRYSVALQILSGVIVAKKEELTIALSSLLMLLLISSSLMYYADHNAQPEAFSSIPATMWWSVATLTTVGYGDMYPSTAIGKVLAGVIAILGIGMFALPAGILGGAFAERAARGGDTVSGSRADDGDT